MRRWSVLGCLLVALARFDGPLAAQETWAPAAPRAVGLVDGDSSVESAPTALLADPAGASSLGPVRADAEAPNPSAQSGEAATTPRTLVEIGRSVPGENPAGRADPETPARLVVLDLQPRGQRPLMGRPLALVELLSTAPDRRAQLEAVAAYWRLAEAVCVYHACLDYEAAVSALAGSAARVEDASVWRGATAASAAVVREAEVALASAQCDAALLARLDPSEAAPLPVDPPHAGAYQTRFDELFATAPAPAQVRLLAKTLPLSAEAIEARAAAVRAAAEVADEEAARYRRGQVAPDTVLAALNRQLRQRQSFHAAVGRFNRQIAEYALGVAPAAAPPEALAGMMIVRPQASRPTGEAAPSFGSVPASQGRFDPAWGAAAASGAGELRPAAAVEPLAPSLPGTGPGGASVAPLGGASGASVPGAGGRPTLAPRRISPATESEARPLGWNETPRPALPGRQVPTRAVRPTPASLSPTTADPADTAPTDPDGGLPIHPVDRPSTSPEAGPSRRLVPIPDDSTNGDGAAIEGPPRAVPYRVDKPPIDVVRPAPAPGDSAAVPPADPIGGAANRSREPANDGGLVPAPSVAGGMIRVAGAEAPEAHEPTTLGERSRPAGAEMLEAAEAAEAAEAEEAEVAEVALTSPALFAGLLQATPASQSAHLAAALCAGAGTGAEQTEPFSLSDCLRAAVDSGRSEAINAYWSARRWASKCQLIEEQIGWLDELARVAGRSVAEGGRVASEDLPARWREARSATEAERLEAQASLVEAQFTLAALTGRGQADRLPMPTTVPHAGRYDPKLAALPPQQAYSWLVRRLAATIGGLGDAVFGHATAVVETDARRAELAGAFARGEGRMEPAIEGIGAQAAAASAFLDALAGYNQAIGRYVLAVAPAGAPVEALHGAMVAEP